ncbi:methylmalonyl-CoA carboxyltransferase, partial [Streptomyces sp. TRM 70351]|nr:methylmalonyl-CoA carboxyltransferase [Streptomyces sp. TRM 70351]
MLTEQPATTATDPLTEFQALRETARQGPSARATEAQHAKGKLTVRERIDLLLDKHSFTE